MRVGFLVLLILSLSQISNASENAIWSGSIFFRGFDPSTQRKLTDERLKQFASELERNGILYVYVFSGPYQMDGHLPSYAFSERAQESVAFLKKSNPDLKILPWIGGVENKTVFLENDKWLKNSLEDTAKLMASGPFDGVHVDLEYVLYPKQGASTTPTGEYDAAWVRFHRKLREALPHTFISTAAVSSAPGTNPWKHKYTLKDLTEVSRFVDQVAFMFYETNIHDLDTYRRNMREQLQQIREMKAKLGSKSPAYLFGIGTFKSEKALQSYRDMRLENVATTLKTLNELLRAVSQPEHLIDGLAIYCEWQTTESDWAQIQANWISLKSGSHATLNR